MSADGKFVAAAARVLGRRVGLRLDAATQTRLTRCVQEAAAARHQDVGDYVSSLESDATALQDLLDRVTVQETSFFRDPGQFEALARDVLPSMRGPLTVWSAGCANGQEAYTLAMVLAESAVADWRVIATDVSTRALDRARRARYSEKETTGVSAERRDRFFVRDGNAWVVAPVLRDRVAVTRHNLVSDAPPVESGRCHIVLCRNVLIYFRPEEVVAFLERLARWMPTDGYLFLGYSESLWQVTEVFKLVRLGDSFVYRPAGAPAKPEAPVEKRQARLRQDAAAPTPRKGPSATARAASEKKAVEALPDVGELLAVGEAAAAAGDYDTAVTAYRKAAYLEPDHPIPHLHLGLALEASGNATAARRAYAAARVAVDRCDTAAVEAALEGYRLDELVGLLDAKLGARG